MRTVRVKFLKAGDQVVLSSISESGESDRGSACTVMSCEREQVNAGGIMSNAYKHRVKFTPQSDVPDVLLRSESYAKTYV